MPKADSSSFVARDRADSSDLPEGVNPEFPSYTPDPTFHSIKAELLSNNSEGFVHLSPNARAATPFETEFFKGEAMFLCRTTPVDHYFQSFFNGKRLFEVQVQGKFKRHPSGEIFCGAEVSNKVELGIITRSMARAAIKFCETLVPNLHSSFGDSPDQPDFEMPHMVSPLFPTFDKIVVTEPGGKPPTIGLPFPETPAQVKIRKKWMKVKDANINIENTYSFSVNTSQVDLLNWKLVGIPMIRPIALNSFFGNSQIRLVGYEMPDKHLGQFPDTQPHHRLNYIFNLKLTQLEFEGPTVTFYEAGEETLEQKAAAAAEEAAASRRTRADSGDPKMAGEEAEELPLPLDMQFEDSGNEEHVDMVMSDDEGDLESPDEAASDDEDGQEMLSGEQGQGKDMKPARRRLFARRGSAGDGGERKSILRATGGWLKRRFVGGKEAGSGAGAGAVGGAGTGTAVGGADAYDEEEHFDESTDFHMTDYEMESSGDLRYCPGSVEVNDYRKDGRRRTLYFLPVPFSEANFPSSSLPPSSTVPAILPPHNTYQGKVAENDAAHTEDGSAIKTDATLALADAQPQYQHRSIQDSLSNLPPLRSYSEIAKVLNLSTIPRMHKNKRLSFIEKRRRQIVEAYKTALKAPGGTENGSAGGGGGTAGAVGSVANPTLNKLRSFLSGTSDADASFLAPMDSAAAVALANKPGNSRSTECWEGSVALATSRRHWSEHYMILNVNEVVFKHSAESRRTRFTIQTVNIISVQVTAVDETALQKCSFFQIETFSRIYYIMVHSDMQLNEWLQAFIILLGAKITRSPFDGKTAIPPSLVNIEDREDFYICKSAACWKLGQKRILNYRRIIFTADGVPENFRDQSPALLVEEALRVLLRIAHPTESSSASASTTPAGNNKRLSLSNNSSSKKRGLTAAHDDHEVSHSAAVQWVRFMDLISMFQTFNLAILPERERAPILLNIYHIMVIHGSLLIGPPPSWNSWNSFFSNIAYLIGYEIISVDELGHNILRASMARPSALSIVSVPQMPFPGIALTKLDFRFNFCINSGSRSMPDAVPIYNAKDLDDQLDEMTSLMISESIEIDVVKKTVILPKFSLHDFTSKHGAYASPLEVLRCLACYITKKEDRGAVSKLLSDAPNIYIRFKQISFRCRVLRLYEKIPAKASVPPPAVNSIKSIDQDDYEE